MSKNLKKPKPFTMKPLTLKEARRWYEDTDAVHDFDHIIRVYNTALRLAKAEGANLETIWATALLLDLQGNNLISVSSQFKFFGNILFLSFLHPEPITQPIRVLA